MSILSRFADIISANINALLEKAEDPAKMIDQYLIKAKEDLAQVKQETAGVMAEETRCKRLMDDAQEAVDKYESLAKKALAAGNEGDARQLIAKKQELEKTLIAATNNYSVAKANADKMRQLYEKLSQDVATLQARRSNIKATVAVAKTQARINEATAAAESAHGSIAAFEKMEQKAQEMLDRANAEAELNGMVAPSMITLEEKYSEPGEAAVEDELARLKAELGM